MRPHAPHARFRLALALFRRIRYRLRRRLTLFSGWIWVAAISFVGVEAFEIAFGMFLLAPELLPVALVGFALAFMFRERLFRIRRRLRAHHRLGRLRRNRDRA